MNVNTIYLLTELLILLCTYGELPNAWAGPGSACRPTSPPTSDRALLDDALCTGTRIPDLKERTLLVSCIINIGTTGIAILCPPVILEQ
ncbi:hypothetical protein V8E52_009013, partial [Russula decolorans]